MANDEHLAKLEEGVEVWNAWREEHPDVRPDLSEANLRGTDLHAANLGKATLSKATLFEANLSEASLHAANLSKAYLHEANLSKADLSRALVAQADFSEAHMDGAILSMLRGAERASGLEAATCAKRDVRYFEHCDRTWLNEYLDWERFRAIGRLPLFGLSYTALILIPIVFFLLAFYNAHVVQLRQLADTIATSWDTTTPAFIQQAAAFIVQHLHPHPIPSQSFLLLLSTLCIGIASTLYTVFCPSRIKEFSRDQWCDQHKNYLIHYWPYAWRRPLIRVACAIFYFLGGAGVRG